MVKACSKRGIMNYKLFLIIMTFSSSIFTSAPARSSSDSQASLSLRLRKAKNDLEQIVTVQNLSVQATSKILSQFFSDIEARDQAYNEGFEAFKLITSTILEHLSNEDREIKYQLQAQVAKNKELEKRLEALEKVAKNRRLDQTID